MDAQAALNSRKNYLPGMREGEAVLAQTVISNGIFWKGIAVFILAIIFLLFAYQLTLFLIFVSLLILGYEFLLKSFLLLVVTNQRVLVRSGVLLVDTIQLQYNKIESVEIQTTVMGQLFGYGTLMVSGTGSRLAFIPFVANPLSIQTVINEFLQQRDLSSRENIQLQARVQAEALAEVLDEHQETKL